MGKDNKTTTDTLRQKAEEMQKMNRVTSVPLHYEAEALKLIHELEVHQIELEMQNEELQEAKNQLENISNNYIELYDFAPSGYFTLSREGIIMELNFSAARLLNKTRSAIKNSHFDFFVSPDTKSIFTLFLEKAFKNIGNVICEVKLISKGHPPTYVHLSGIVTENGERCLVTVLDISECKRAQESLIASEARYRSLFELASEGILLMDAETGRITDVNPFLIQLFNSSEDQFLGKGIWEIEFLKDKLINHHQFLELQKREYFHMDDMLLVTSDGRTFNAECHIHAYFVAQKKVIQYIIRDITKQEVSELAFRNSETHLRTLVQTIPDLIWLKDTKGIYLSCNSIFERFFGAREAAIVGKTDYDFVDQELADFFRENDQKAMKAGKPTINEEWISFADDGHRVYLETIKCPMYNSKGILLGVLGIGRDITERKLAAQEVIESEKRFRAIFDQAPIAIALLDLKGHPIISNLTLSNMLGYTSEELAKMKFTEFTYHEDIDRDMNQYSDLIDGKISSYSMEKRYIHKNGKLIWGNLFVTTLSDQNGLSREMLGMIEDITERKLAEEEITMLSQSLKSINECVCITDLEDKICFVNESFLKTYGHCLDQLIGKNISLVGSPNNELAKVNEILPSTINGNWQGELLQRRKDGSEFPIYLSTSNIKDKENKVIGLIGVAIDISARIDAEKELIKAKEQAEESDRLKSAFLANMSHEVRTPLNSIIGFSELLEDSHFRPQQKTEFIHQIITNGNNLLTIISDIMDISKLESGVISIHKSQLKAQQFITGIWEQFSFQVAEKKLEFKLSLPDTDEEIVLTTDAGRLRQVFNNLINNALKFTAKGSIEIGLIPYGKMIEFYVRDTGIGIPAKYHDKIFDRFRQVEDPTRRSYGGNGLGLAITKNLVELMGGKIHVESELGKGSTFYFTIA